MAIFSRPVTARALLVKGTLAFLGYKFGTFLWEIDGGKDVIAKHFTSVRNEVVRIQTQTLEASESKLQKDFEDLLTRRKKKEERAFKN